MRRGRDGSDAGLRAGLLARWRGVAVSGVLIAGTLGCGGAQQADESITYTEAAEAAYERANRLYERKDWAFARAAFERVAQQYPYSRFATLAELRVADTYYGEKAFGSAIESYRRFIRLHPTHDRTLYAEFRIVEAYQRRMPRESALMPPTHERDLTDALLAAREASRFLLRNPDTEYTEQATALLVTVVDRLARHEHYTARYYERRENYLAALRRYRYQAETWPQSTLTAEALVAVVRLGLELEDIEAAQWALGRLERMEDQAAAYERARRMLRTYDGIGATSRATE